VPPYFKKSDGRGCCKNWEIHSVASMLLTLLNWGEFPLCHEARSFSAAAPKLWNGLPEELCQATSLDSFKSRLKTYL